MKTSLLIVLVAVLAVAVGLAATNPTTEQYAAFLHSQLSQAVDRMEQPATGNETPQQTAILRSLLKSHGTQVISALTRTHTTRRDFGLFSIFATTAFGVRIEVLGVATRFFPLDDQQELLRKLGQATL